MKKTILMSFTTIALAASFTPGAYNTITPAQLYARLVNCDTLLIVDVREKSDYTANHIAEPSGQLPLTPAILPWNTKVLQANYTRLPRDIDIIVQCASGARSKLASAFLDSAGFTRIYNMTGGFGAWTYEKRSGSFGDNTGAWTGASFTASNTTGNDSARIILYPAAFTAYDSVYCEIHAAYGKQPSPPDAPVSNAAGLFRVTALDKFGIPLFAGDSLVLADTVGISLIPAPKHSVETGLTALAGAGIWQSLTFNYNEGVFSRSENVLRKWYNAASNSSGTTFRPFVKTGVRAGSTAIKLFDLRGRLISNSGISSCRNIPPAGAGSGFYIIDNNFKMPRSIVK